MCATGEELPELGAPIGEIERFVLSHVLFWKLSYATPYDFIQLITLKLKEEMGKPVPAAVVTKAACMADLLLLCKFFPYLPLAMGRTSAALRPPLAIGLAALMTSCSMMGESELSRLVELSSPVELSVRLSLIHTVSRTASSSLSDALPMSSL